MALLPLYHVRSIKYPSIKPKESYGQRIINEPDFTPDVYPTLYLFGEEFLNEADNGQ